MVEEKLVINKKICNIKQLKESNRFVYGILLYLKETLTFFESKLEEPSRLQQNNTIHDKSFEIQSNNVVNVINLSPSPSPNITHITQIRVRNKRNRENAESVQSKRKKQDEEK